MRLHHCHKLRNHRPPTTDHRPPTTDHRPLKFKPRYAIHNHGIRQLTFICQHPSIHSCVGQLFAVGHRHFKLRDLSPRILYVTQNHATQTNNAVDAGCKCRILRSGVACGCKTNTGVSGTMRRSNTAVHGGSFLRNTK